MFGWIYLAGAILTSVLVGIDEYRHGSDEWRWLPFCFPIWLLWPLIIIPVTFDLIDGPRQPKHRARVW